jgi:hypothetical protein
LKQGLEIGLESGGGLGNKVFLKALHFPSKVGDEKHLYVVPATNLRCLHLRAKFSHAGAGLGGVVCIKGL